MANTKFTAQNNDPNATTGVDWHDWTVSYGQDSGTWAGATMIARYSQIGKTVSFIISALGEVTAGSPTSLYFTLPVNMNSSLTANLLGGGCVTFSGGGINSSGHWRNYNTTTGVQVQKNDKSAFSSTSCGFSISGSYEAA